MSMKHLMIPGTDQIRVDNLQVSYVSSNDHEDSVVTKEWIADNISNTFQPTGDGGAYISHIDNNSIETKDLSVIDENAEVTIEGSSPYINEPAAVLVLKSSKNTEAIVSIENTDDTTAWEIGRHHNNGLNSTSLSIDHATGGVNDRVISVEPDSVSVTKQLNTKNVDIQGTLDVSDDIVTNAEVHGTKLASSGVITATGNITGANITANANMNCSNLNASGNITATGDCFADEFKATTKITAPQGSIQTLNAGTASVWGPLGSVSLSTGTVTSANINNSNEIVTNKLTGTTLKVNGSSELNGTTTVNDSCTFSGTCNTVLNGPVAVNNTIDVNTELKANLGLSVTGNTTVQGVTADSLGVTGNTTLNTATVSGPLTVTGDVDASTQTITAAKVVAPTVEVSTLIDASTGQVKAGTLSCTGQTSLSNTEISHLTVLGDSDLKQVNCTGVNATSTVSASDVTVTGTITGPSATITNVGVPGTMTASFTDVGTGTIDQANITTADVTTGNIQTLNVGEPSPGLPGVAVVNGSLTAGATNLESLDVAGTLSAGVLNVTTINSENATSSTAVQAATVNATAGLQVGYPETPGSARVHGNTEVDTFKANGRSDLIGDVYGDKAYFNYINAIDGNILTNDLYLKGDITGSTGRIVALDFISADRMVAPDSLIFTLEARDTDIERLRVLETANIDDLTVTGQTTTKDIEAQIIDATSLNASGDSTLTNTYVNGLLDVSIAGSKLRGVTDVDDLQTPKITVGTELAPGTTTVHGTLTAKDDLTVEGETTLGRTDTTILGVSDKLTTHHMDVTGTMNVTLPMNANGGINTTSINTTNTVNAAALQVTGVCTLDNVTTSQITASGNVTIQNNSNLTVAGNTQVNTLTATGSINSPLLNGDITTTSLTCAGLKTTTINNTDGVSTSDLAVSGHISTGTATVSAQLNTGQIVNVGDIATSNLNASTVNASGLTTCNGGLAVNGSDTDMTGIGTLTLGADYDMSAAGEVNLQSGAKLAATTGSSMEIHSGADFDAWSNSNVNLNNGSNLNMKYGSNLIIESGADIEVNSGGDINVNSGGDIVVYNGGDIDVVSGGDININSGGEIRVNSGGDIRYYSNGQAWFYEGSDMYLLDGSDVFARGNFQFQTTGTLDISTTAPVTVGTNIDMPSHQLIAGSVMSGPVTASDVTVGNDVTATDVTATGTVTASSVSSNSVSTSSVSTTTLTVDGESLDVSRLTRCPDVYKFTPGSASWICTDFDNMIIVPGDYTYSPSLSNLFLGHASDGVWSIQICTKRDTLSTSAEILITDGIDWADDTQNNSCLLGWKEGIINMKIMRVGSLLIGNGTAYGVPGDSGMMPRQFGFRVSDVTLAKFMCVGTQKWCDGDYILISKLS